MASRLNGLECFFLELDNLSFQRFLEKQPRTTQYAGILNKKASDINQNVSEKYKLVL